MASCLPELVLHSKLCLFVDKTQFDSKTIHSDLLQRFCEPVGKRRPNNMAEVNYDVLVMLLHKTMRVQYSSPGVSFIKTTLRRQNAICFNSFRLLYTILLNLCMLQDVTAFCIPLPSHSVVPIDACYLLTHLHLCVSCRPIQ